MEKEAANELNLELDMEIACLIGEKDEKEKETTHEEDKIIWNN